MSFEDVIIWSRLLTFTQIASRIFLCLNNRNVRVAYFYLSVMYLKGFNVCSHDVRITNWKFAIKAYRNYKAPR